MSSLENLDSVAAPANTWTLPVTDPTETPVAEPSYGQQPPQIGYELPPRAAGRHAVDPIMTEETTVIPGSLINAIDQTVKAEASGGLSPFFTPAVPAVEASGVNMFAPVELTDAGLGELAGAPISSLLGGLNQLNPEFADLWMSAGASSEVTGLPPLPATAETPKITPVELADATQAEQWPATDPEVDPWQPSSTAVMFAGKVATAPFDPTGIPEFQDRLMPPAWAPDASEFEPVRILS